MTEKADTGRQQRPEGEDGPVVTLGRISGAYGVKGWVKVYSETSPRENILDYAPWDLLKAGRRQRVQVAAGRAQGRVLVARLEGCDDRDTAEALVGSEIQVPRSRLPDDLAPGEYYWADLVGLRVETLDGVELGRIDRLFETGANDVIVVAGERERLLPYVWQQVVREVDLAAGVMRVDWDPDF